MSTEITGHVVELVKAAFSSDLMQFIYDHKATAYSHTIGFRYIHITIERTPRAPVTDHFSVKVCVFCPIGCKEVVSQCFPPELFGIDPHYEFGIQGASQLQLFKQSREPIYVSARRFREGRDPYRAILDLVESVNSLAEEIQRYRCRDRNSSWE